MINLHLLIFEDDLTMNFYPITLTRPAFDLILGTKTLLDAILDELKPEHYSLLVSEYLSPITLRRHPKVDVNPEKVDGEVIFINSLLRLDIHELKKLLMKNNRFVAFSNNNLAIAKVGSKLAKEVLVPPGPMAKTFSTKFKGYADEIKLNSSSLIRYPWHLIELNHEVIIKQTLNIKKNKDLDKNSIICGPNSRLIIEEGVEIEGPVFFDTREGPIYINSKTKILPFSRIKGPSYIGKNSIVSSAIVDETTVGDFVKIGGHVHRSIFANYSNKAHEGFIGHSYIGEWVNIGANTTNSDLKNTYGTIKMMIKDERIDSGMIKIGSFIADNVKTSIGSFIYTGKRIGVASQIHGYVFDDVPSFTIYAKSMGYRLFEVHLESAIETQKRMMKRKGIEQTKEDVDLLRKVFEISKEERYKAGVIKGKFSFLMGN
ncbi:MAG: putative sugar nucleotidyl transferase [Nitrososphaerales archaeon]